MPELPEVETTRRGLAPVVENRRIASAIVRNRALRLPVPLSLPRVLAGQTISRLGRRGKYLLFTCDTGTLILHLGMSGRLWLVDRSTPAAPHDHFDLVMDNGAIVRLRDPRRFGLVLWARGDPLRHTLLAALGPEPFDAAFTAEGLYRVTRKRSAPIKQVLMDGRVVAGVGNIYANEALFRARLNPRQPAHRIGLARYQVLVHQIRETLEQAIGAGGSSLRDYVGSDGLAGSFQSQFSVYDRGGAPCPRCSTPITAIRQAQRSTFYCRRCQR
ncbi:MAG: bifunctional DNA-formamidopyrimidine glycosylase/DNA-(apurinic or apyrimidinic site) lyase [Betaproteobacteria bacterium]